MTSHNERDLPDAPAPVHAALTTYRERFGATAAYGPLTVAWAPGRVNLIGEHTDYNDGWVLPVAIDRAVAIAGRRLAAPEVQCVSAHHRGYVRFPIPVGGVVVEQPGRVRGLPLWGRFVRAVLSEYLSLPETGALSGFAAAIVGNVPVGGGMSSSAALEVAVATYVTALGGPAFPPIEVARLCQRAEQRAAGVRVGIMDQATACLGRKDHAILLDCRTLEYTYIPASFDGATLLIYNTGVPHSLAATAYNERRAQCEEAVRALANALRDERPARSISALRDVTAADLKSHADALPDVLLRRARHVVSENERVLRAVEALRASDLETLGQLLFASHASLRDDYEVSCPELDAVVEIATQVAGVYGARMMGAGFGGSALILVRSSQLEALQRALASEYPQRTGRIGQAHVCHSADGAGWLAVGKRGA
jgi:galactokinase